HHLFPHVGRAAHVGGIDTGQRQTAHPRPLVVAAHAVGGHEGGRGTGRRRRGLRTCGGGCRGRERGQPRHRGAHAENRAPDVHRAATCTSPAPGRASPAWGRRRDRAG